MRHHGERATGANKVGGACGGRAWIAVLAAVALALAACTAGGGGAKTPTTSKTVDTTPKTITFWEGFSANHEKAAIRAAVAKFHARYPWITVKLTDAITDENIVNAIHGGNPPDAAMSFTTDNVGEFCAANAFQDLGSYAKADGTDLSVIPQAARDYTSYKGKQCTLPMLADTYGLYYNTDMFTKAGLDPAKPPQTMSELVADAEKLTVRNPDGSIKVAGFVPLWGFYEASVAHLGQSWGAQWLDADGKSNISTDPRWAEMAKWQKQLVDWYGYKNLVKFAGQPPDEFSAQNMFESGKLAMNLDGEWRVAFLADEKPNLNYATAPFPAADDQPGQYGAGFVSGNIIGIPRGAKHPEQAWLLVKFLATDTAAQVGLSNDLRNVPTVTAALSSPDIKPDQHFKTFLDIFGNPKSAAVPPTPVGAALQNNFQDVLVKYQAGNVRDLQAALQGVDKTNDNQLAQQVGAP